MSRWLAYAGACVLALAGTFAAGRFSARSPDSVETERVVYQSVVVTKTVVVTEKAKHETKVVYREVKPDGSRTEVERTETHETERTNSDTGRTEVARDETEKSKTVTTPLPDWRVSVLAGLDVPSLFSAELRPVYGVQLQRRVLGPLSVGVWGLSTGQLGLSLALDF